MSLNDPRQLQREIITTPNKQQETDVVKWQGNHSKLLSDRIRTRVIRAPA
jgi:hypothetical protein